MYWLFDEEGGEFFELSCYHDCGVGVESAVMLDEQVSVAVGRFLNRFDTSVGEIEILLFDVIIRVSKRIELESGIASSDRFSCRFGKLGWSDAVVIPAVKVQSNS